MSLAVPLCLSFVLAFAPVAPVSPSTASLPWPDLAQPPPAQGGGERDTAVIVGISDYAFAPDIAGATANAVAWYRWLTVARGIAPERVQLLRDQEATAEELRAAAKRAAAEGERGANVWFVFIGHGAPARTGDDGLLVGVDAQQTANSLDARSVRQGELLATLESSKASPIVVLDACFSGRASDGAELAEGLQPLQVASLAAPNVALVLSAGQSDQYAGPLPGADRPAFSYLVLGAMRGWGDDDRDGKVTAGEAVAYADGAMRAVLRGRSQTPQLRGRAHGAVLAIATEPGPDLATLTIGTPATPARNAVASATPAGADVLPPAEHAAPPRCLGPSSCAFPYACVDGACRVSQAKLDDLHRNARRLVIAGGATTGAAALMFAVGGGLNLRSSDYDSASADAGSGLILVGVAAGVAGLTTLTVGLVRRRKWKRHAGLARVQPGAAGLAVHF